VVTNVHSYQGRVCVFKEKRRRDEKKKRRRKEGEMEPERQV